MREEQSRLESAAIILSKAISFLLLDGEGVFVKIDTELPEGKTVQNLIVFKSGEEINIYNTDNDLKDGTKLMMDKYSGK